MTAPPPRMPAGLLAPAQGVDILSRDQVAALLDCETKTVDDAARRGQLPALKFGRSWIFPRDALMVHLNRIALSKAAAMPNDADPDPVDPVPAEATSSAAPQRRPARPVQARQRLLPVPPRG